MNTDDSIALQIKDAVRLSYLRDKPYFIGFLNEDEIQLALSQLDKESAVSYMLFGGIENADRVMAGIFPESITPTAELFPIKSVEIRYNKQYELSHRDFLGALMSLGIKRSCVGDIKISSGIAYVMLKSEISDYVVSQLNKIGRVGVKLSYSELTDFISSDDTEYLNITVSSLRLDNIVSAVLNLSREKSSVAVKSGLVSVNHTVKQSPSFQLKENDTIVFKGKGKFVLDKLMGESKKGKKKLIIKKYR